MYVRVRFPMLTASSYHCAGMIPGPFFKQIIATVLPVYKCILFLPFGATCTITYFSVLKFSSLLAAEKMVINITFH